MFKNEVIFPANMSIDEKMYLEFYRRHETDRESHGANSQKKLEFIRGVKPLIGITAVLSWAGLIGYSAINKKINDKKIGRREFLFGSGLATAATGLTVHFDQFQTLEEAIHKKNAGYELTEKEITEAQRAGALGRYSHLMGPAGLTVAIGAGISYTDEQINRRYAILCGGVFLTLLPIWWRETMIKAYGSLYQSSVDYVSGQKMEFRPNKPAPK